MSATWLRRGKVEASADGLAQRDQRLVWRIAALLLDYPTEQTLEMLDELQAAAVALPAPAGTALVSFLAEIRRRPPMQLAAPRSEGRGTVSIAIALMRVLLRPAPNRPT